VIVCSWHLTILDSVQEYHHVKLITSTQRQPPHWKHHCGDTRQPFGSEWLRQLLKPLTFKMYLQHDVWLSLHFTRVGLTASQIQTEYYKSYIALHSRQLCNWQIVTASITHKLICNLFISWQNSILSAPTNSTTTVDTHLACKSTSTKYIKKQMYRQLL